MLLSPFDVRQGNFVGALINAVTKSGTNEFHGRGYGFMRDQKITRTQAYLDDYNQKQYGFTLGGPIVKDKAFFFVNPEWQRQDAANLGTIHRFLRFADRAGESRSRQCGA